jgi:hypothetical protein
LHSAANWLRRTAVKPGRSLPPPRSRPRQPRARQCCCRCRPRASRKESGPIRAAGPLSLRIVLLPNSVAKKAQSKSLDGGQGTLPLCCRLASLQRGAVLAPLRYPKVLGPTSQTGGALVLRRVNAGAKNRPPKGKGGPRLGSLDKGWCRHEWVLNDSEFMLGTKLRLFPDHRPHGWASHRV